MHQNTRGRSPLRFREWNQQRGGQWNGELAKFRENDLGNQSPVLEPNVNRACPASRAKEQCDSSRSWLQQRRNLQKRRDQDYLLPGIALGEARHCPSLVLARGHEILHIRKAC